MKTYSSDELAKILRLHSRWLYLQSGGIRADLSFVDCQRKNFVAADLRSANLYGADFRNANFQNSNLRDACLCRVNFGDANLRNANLRGTDLDDVNFDGADLRGTDFQNVNLCRVNFSNTIYENDIPIIFNTEFYNVIKCKQYIQIGCRKHTLEEWKAFSDDEIDMMDDDALRFWKKYKKLILLED